MSRASAFPALCCLIAALLVAAPLLARTDDAPAAGLIVTRSKDVPDRLTIITPKDGIDIRDVIKAIKQQMGVNILLDKNVTGKVSLSMKNVHFEKVLEFIAKTNGLAVRKEGNTYIIGRAKDLSEGFDQGVYRPSHPSPFRRCFRGVDTPPRPAPETGSTAPPRAPGTEEYARIDENEFKDVRLHPLSTFSADVDTASYAIARRYLLEGARPPKDAVRIEEFVNYFLYDPPHPRDGHPIALAADVAGCPWNPAHRLAHIVVATERLAPVSLPPSNLVFLVDVSGSMNEPDKLPLLKDGLRLLVGALGSRDRVAIVVYAGAAGLVLPSTPASDRPALLAAIDRLQAGGSTAGAAGIALAYRVALENFIRGGDNRVILATDGDFNVGVSNDNELSRLIEEKRGSGVFLSVLGFGTGNYKDSKMETLADRGNGNYAYIDSVREARKVLVERRAGTIHCVAKDVKLQVEFNPALVSAYRLIGYENRALNAEDFKDDRKDAGEIGAGHDVTVFYELVPAGSPERHGDVDPLKYQRPDASAAPLSTSEIMTVKARYKPPAGDASRELSLPVVEPPAGAPLSSDFRFAAAVAEFGMLLMDSKHKGAATYDRVRALAADSLGDDPGGFRREFLDIVERARTLHR